MKSKQPLAPRYNGGHAQRLRRRDRFELSTRTQTLAEKSEIRLFFCEPHLLQANPPPCLKKCGKQPTSESLQHVTQQTWERSPSSRSRFYKLKNFASSLGGNAQSTFSRSSPSSFRSARCSICLSRRKYEE